MAEPVSSFTTPVRGATFNLLHIIRAALPPLTSHYYTCGLDTQAQPGRNLIPNVPVRQLLIDGKGRRSSGNFVIIRPAGFTQSLAVGINALFNTLLFPAFHI